MIASITAAAVVDVGEELSFLLCHSFRSFVSLDVCHIRTDPVALVIFISKLLNVKWLRSLTSFLQLNLFPVEFCAADSLNRLRDRLVVREILVLEVDPQVLGYVFISRLV